MREDIYRNIAELIVKANELKLAEKKSAEYDLGEFEKEVSDGNTTSPAGGNINAQDYSAYLNRVATGIGVADDMEDYSGRIRKESELLSAISGAEALMAQEKLKADEYNTQREWDYVNERDEANDRFYEMRQENKSPGKTSSSTSSVSSGSSSKKETGKEEDTMKGTYYVNRMPDFNTGTSAKDRMDNEVYSKKFREKALQLSSDGTKKADRSEMNALVKMAEKYGASEEYIEWIHNVCGYM